MHQLSGMEELRFQKIAVRILSNDADATHIVAIRKPLDESFDKIKINTITDTGIQKILKNHLSRYADDPKKAFRRKASKT